MPGIALRSSFSARGLGALSSQPNWFAFYKYSGNNEVRYNECTAIANDPGGNVFTYMGMDNGSGSPIGILSKLSSTGNLIWSKEIGAIFSVSDAASLIANSTNLYLFIKVSGSKLTLHKFDLDGNYVWKKDLTLSSTSATVGSVCVSSTIYVSFLHRYNDGVNNYIRAVIANLDTDGNILWQTRYLTESAMVKAFITLDGSNNIYMIQSPTVDSTTFRSHLTKLNSSGVVQWDIKFQGAVGAFSEPSIALDSSGNIFISAYETGLLGGTRGLIWVMKFTNSGTLVSAKYLYPSSTSQFYVSRDLVIGSDDTVYVTGYFSYTVSSQLNREILIAKFSNDLTLQWCMNEYTEDAGGIRYSLPYQILSTSPDLLVGGTFYARTSATSISPTFATMAKIPNNGKGSGIYLVNTSTGNYLTTYTSTTSVQVSSYSYSVSTFVSMVYVTADAVAASVTPSASATSLITYVAQV